MALGIYPRHVPSSETHGFTKGPLAPPRGGRARYGQIAHVACLSLARADSQNLRVAIGRTPSKSDSIKACLDALYDVAAPN